MTYIFDGFALTNGQIAVIRLFQDLAALIAAMIIFFDQKALKKLNDELNFEKKKSEIQERIINILYRNQLNELLESEIELFKKELFEEYERNKDSNDVQKIKHSVFNMMLNELHEIYPDKSRQELTRSILECLPKLS